MPYSIYYRPDILPIIALIDEIHPIRCRVIFLNIGEYVACSFYLLLLGGITCTNTTSGSIPGFVPGLNTILSLTLSFFHLPVSGIRPDTQFLGIIGSVTCIVFDRFIFLITLFPISIRWVVSILFGFYTFCELVRYQCVFLG